MIKKTLKTTLQYLDIFGIDPLKAIWSLRGMPAYISDYLELKRQKSESNGDFEFGQFKPYLGDRFTDSGQARGHYFHQDLLVASKIFANEPMRHIDVGSRIDGFVAHVASFRKISVIDIRPLSSRIHNVEFLQADLMSALPTELHDVCDSLSCLHALEHFGLGRYGDPVRWGGYQMGFDNLLSMLKPDGKFYFSVPIGPQRIEFNAHRVFSIAYLLEMFRDRLRLDDFSFVDDRGDLHESILLDEQAKSSNCGCTYGCGIFELTKVNS